MGDYIGAVDQGTTSSRFIIFDRRGRIKAMDQKEHKQIFPKAGLGGARPHGGVDQRGRGDPGRIGQGRGSRARTWPPWASPTSARPPWSGTRPRASPCGNAIVWQCTRTHDICKELMASGGQDRFRETTGLPVATYFSGPKIKWIMDNVSGARAALESGNALVGTMETWVIWRLTGGPQGGAHVTDVTNASRTMLMNLATLDWDQDILDVLGVPRAALPRIVPSSDSQTWGPTMEDGPMGARVPVCGALGDQQAALVGQACFDVGEAKNTYGTGCFLLLNTGETPVPSRHGLITTLAYQIRWPQARVLPGGLHRHSRGPGAVAARQPGDHQHRARGGGPGPAGGGQRRRVLRARVPGAVRALLAVRRARGVIVGLTRYANKHHLARAVLEANAYQAKDIVEAMNKDSGVDLASLKVDGGMVFNELLMQFQSDVLDVPVIRPKVSETTCLGAAYAAGLAVGFWSGPGRAARQLGHGQDLEARHVGPGARGRVRGLEKGRGAHPGLGRLGEQLKKRLLPRCGSKPRPLRRRLRRGPLPCAAPSRSSF